MTKQKRILSLAAAVIMASTSLTATGVYASEVSDEHDCDIDSYAQELMASGEITDESIALFNDFISTLDEESAALILSDEELVRSMQMVNYWKPSTDNADSISAYSSVTLPLAAYPSGSYFSGNGRACTCHKNCTYSVPENYSVKNRCYDQSTGSSGNCIRYAATGSIQCKAFADYVFKQYNGVDCSAQNATNKTLSSVTTESIGTYITRYLNVGSHLRGTLVSGSYHSIIITSITSTGISYYQANTNGTCNVSTGTKTWVELGKWFASISNSWTV